VDSSARYLESALPPNVTYVHQKMEWMHNLESAVEWLALKSCWRYRLDKIKVDLHDTRADTSQPQLLAPTSQ
jgi:hypothetical protein